MLRKVIAAAMSAALLANASMISSANDSYAENSATTETEVASTSAAAETEVASTSVETTVVSTVSTDEATTTATETTSLEDVGAAIRMNLKVKVRDVVYFGDKMDLYDKEDEIYQSDAGESIYIVGIDDAKQRFFVVAEKKDYLGILRLKYEDVEHAESYTVMISHEGFVIGDLDYNGKINAKDFSLMKRFLMYGWNDKLTQTMADWNGDNQVNMKDLVLMHHWLLGIK